jgi:uncharacterized protein
MTEKRGKARILRSMKEITPAVWNRLANPPDSPFNPFVAHEFLSSLEESGSATARTGWQGAHLMFAAEDETVLGLVPCYLKDHSYGEYVFDHGWAEAYERAGGNYYPKLQASIPFTPATGPRLLAPTPEIRASLARELITLCGDTSASSIHITFLPDEDWTALGGRQWLKRQDIQFHWHNQGYANFEDFLAALASRKRKNIRKERDTVRAAGIEVQWITGKDITERHWDDFFILYMETGSRKWGTPYLTRRFFSMIGERMAQHILLVTCKRAGRVIAAALNFIGSDALYGRNWGATEHHACLHFEACYYQAIDFAISHKLARVEAGAQGPHKLARGYVPATTHSLHYLADPRLSRAVADYLAREREAVGEEQEFLASHAPFRESDF